MAKTKQEVFTSPWALPIVRDGATKYFADLRLREFRNISYPHNYIGFDSEQGRSICRQNGIIICPHCGTSVIISPSLDIGKLRCVKCFSLLVPVFDI